MGRRFKDRVEAGRKLADELSRYKSRDDVVVLGLPRGGVPVAFEVARAIAAPLDVLVIRKVGVPGHEELAMGAVATGDTTVYNDSVIRQVGIDDTTFERVASAEREALAKRELLFRGDRKATSVTGKTVIVVDDGIATGSTMKAAVKALRQNQPDRIIIAVPVAPAGTIRELELTADEVICLVTPHPFLAVGAWYRDFAQTTDSEVRRLLDNRD